MNSNSPGIRKMKKRILLATKLIVSVGLIALVASRLDFDELTRATSEIRPEGYVVALALAFGNLPLLPPVDRSYGRDPDAIPISISGWENVAT